MVADFQRLFVLRQGLLKCRPAIKNGFRTCYCPGMREGGIRAKEWAQSKRGRVVRAAPWSNAKDRMRRRPQTSVAAKSAATISRDFQIPVLSEFLRCARPARETRQPVPAVRHRNRPAG